MSYPDELARFPELAGLLPLTNLEEVIHHLAFLGFGLGKMDSVAQDEFTHDLRVAFPDGRRHLVIGIT